jgi:hypothetical protein
MKSSSNEPYKITIDIFIDEVFKYTYKAKSESLIRDLKSNILQQTGMYSINYLLYYANRDYTSFDNSKLKEIFMAHREVQVNLKSIEMFKKGK